jgi:hypothetical protein
LVYEAGSLCPPFEEFPKWLFQILKVGFFFKLLYKFRIGHFLPPSPPANTCRVLAARATVYTLSPLVKIKKLSGADWADIDCIAELFSQRTGFLCNELPNIIITLYAPT